MDEREVRLTVNGVPTTVRCDPATPLLDVLRHDLGLAGPRFGCGMGLCGACFVLVDGMARSSCDLPAWAAEGHEVTTVEGLAAPADRAGRPGPPQPHPLQSAFLAEQAAQCGYCTAGMIVAAAGLLTANPAPAEQEIRAALAGNLCRCGSYGRIVRAVLRAAKAAAHEPPGAAP